MKTPVVGVPGSTNTATAVAPANVYQVGQSGCPYVDIPAAIAAINAGTAPTQNNQAVIFVNPGLYRSTTSITVPQFVSIIGVGAALLVNDATDLFICSGNNVFQNLTFYQSLTANTWIFNVGDNNLVTVLDCNMYGIDGNGDPQGQGGFIVASGSNWWGITLRRCSIDSQQNAGYICSFTNTSTYARYLVCLIENCLMNAWWLGAAGGVIFTSGVQDFRIERSTLRGLAPYNQGVHLEQGALDSSHTAQLDIHHCYTVGGASVSNGAGTSIILLNSDCAGATFAGAVVNHNSFVGADYNPLEI